MDTQLKTQLPKKKNNSLTKLIKVGFIVFLIFFSYKLGIEKGTSDASPHALENVSIINKENGKEIIDFSIFWEAWDIVIDKYVDAEELDINKMLYGAIDGMLRASGDPYTNFIDPEEMAEINEGLEGTFEGIGAEMEMKEDILTIVAPLEGSPAQRAGLRAGDKILKIDGESTMDMNIYAAVKLIRGPKDTDVTLGIFRSGNGNDILDIVVTRDVIKVDSIKLEFKGNNIAYIKVSRFGTDTIDAFDQAIRDIFRQKSSKIILDFRNNPGGLLDVSVQMASRLLPRRKIILIQEDSDGDRKEQVSLGGDRLSHLETVVLINEGSASASEILAGALKENRSNVTIVGKKSFGKGSVQELVELKDNTAVKVTVAKWLTPQENQINKEGITPDVEVEMTNEDYENDRDPQLDKAIEILK